MNYNVGDIIKKTAETSESLVNNLDRGWKGEIIDIELDSDFSFDELYKVADCQYPYRIYWFSEKELDMEFVKEEPPKSYDEMYFPDTWEEFVDSYSFEDKKEIYTNGAELILVHRVRQMVEHYFDNIEKRAAERIMLYLDDANNRLTYAQNYINNVKERAKKM